MGLFFYTQKGSIISMVDLPTTEIIEPQFFMHSFLIFLLIYELIFFVIYRRGTLFLKKKY